MTDIGRAPRRRAAACVALVATVAATARAEDTPSVAEPAHLSIVEFTNIKTTAGFDLGRAQRAETVQAAALETPRGGDASTGWSA